MSNPLLDQAYGKYNLADCDFITLISYLFMWNQTLYKLAITCFIFTRCRF